MSRIECLIGYQAVWRLRGGPEMVELFDAADQLITSFAVPYTGFSTAGPESNSFIGAISTDTPIASVVLHDHIGDGGETVGIDDVYFGVPEPASLSLLALGAMVMLRRR